MVKDPKKAYEVSKYTAKLFSRTEKYAANVEKLFSVAVDELLKMTAGSELGEDGTFSFGGNKRLSSKANKVLRGLYSSVYNEIKGDVSAEWEYANLSCDELIESIFGKGLDEDNHFARWFTRSKEAVDAFFKRKSAYGGLNLSQRVWQYVGELKTEIEVALSVSLGQGDSASTVGRKVRKYLNNPDDMFRRFRVKVGEDEDGNPVYGRKWKRKYIDPQTGKVTWKDFDPKDYHTGRGVYRSAYKNAMRLTRTETNMAYRSSEQDRWQRMDFVLGFRVKRSRNHPDTDICDDLSAANDDNESDRGVYPKTFVFKGWHPQCRCFVVPILASRADFIKMQKALLNGEEPPQPSGKIEEPNEYFNEWVSKNRDRIEKAKTLPYWVEDNMKAVEKAMASTEEDEIMEEKSSEETKKEKLQSTNNTEKENQYEVNLKEYERLLADENYTDVAFNEENGGLKATHIRHNFDGAKGWYEEKVRDVGFKEGNSVILKEEIHTIQNKRNTEGTWNGMLFEIAAAENATKTNIRNALKHCAKKPGTEVAVIFFASKEFKESEFLSGFSMFNGLPENQYKKFKIIYCLSKDRILYIKKPE